MCAPATSSRYSSVRRYVTRMRYAVLGISRVAVLDGVVRVVVGVRVPVSVGGSGVLVAITVAAGVGGTTVDGVLVGSLVGAASGLTTALLTDGSSTASGSRTSSTLVATAS